MSKVPISVLTDSYKASHFVQYPPCEKMVCYGEFRSSFQKDKEDLRGVFYGISFILDEYLNRQWTEQDVEKAKYFYKTHCAGFRPYPFPEDLFNKFIKENNGYFPIVIEALEEGTSFQPHTPVYQITAEGEYSPLVTFFETILTHIWYPSTVATLSRRSRDRITAAFEKSVDEDNYFLIPSRLHDFGFRGATCVEQAIRGGSAHLLSFDGSDTMAAAYYAQDQNEGKPVSTSIPATEHSVMTSWGDEEKAINNMIQEFGDGLFACVLDSYDYYHCLDHIIPKIVEKKNSKDGFMVFRPDSGDPSTVVLAALRSGEKNFGCKTNSKGYKVLNGVGVIQGDGINLDSLTKILEDVLKEGYSAQNVAFGMGGGLLQKVNRDTMSFATKLCYIQDIEGLKKSRDIMKKPKSDPSKQSLPGILQVLPHPETGLPTVYPISPEEHSKRYLKSEEEREKDRKEGRDKNLLRIVYNKGPIKQKRDTFEEIRNRLQSTWTSMPKHYDNISSDLKQKMENWIPGKRY